MDTHIILTYRTEIRYWIWHRGHNANTSLVYFCRGWMHHVGGTHIWHLCVILQTATSVVVSWLIASGYWQQLIVWTRAPLLVLPQGFSLVLVTETMNLILMMLRWDQIDQELNISENYLKLWQLNMYQGLKFACTWKKMNAFSFKRLFSFPFSLWKSF